MHVKKKIEFFNSSATFCRERRIFTLLNEIETSAVWILLNEKLIFIRLINFYFLCEWFFFLNHKEFSFLCKRNFMCDSGKILNFKPRFMQKIFVTKSYVLINLTLCKDHWKGGKFVCVRQLANFSSPSKTIAKNLLMCYE